MASMVHEVSMTTIRLLSILLLAAALPVAAAPPEIPAYRGWVNDFAGVLEPAAEQRLANTISALERSTGAEIAVVTVRDAGELGPKMLAVELLNRWGVGKKGQDNGLVLLLALAERRLEVEVGYGLEGDLPDGRAVAVLREEAVPLLGQGRYGDAIAAVVDRYVQILGSEGPAAQPRRGREPAGEAPPAGGALLFVAFAGLILLLLLGTAAGRHGPSHRPQRYGPRRHRTQRHDARGYGAPGHAQQRPGGGLLPLLLGLWLGSGRHRGGGGFGGFGGGGGFGGFGGGSSGGGGGGVDW
jgi:uncharacterized protein